MMHSWCLLIAFLVLSVVVGISPAERGVTREDRRLLYHLAVPGNGNLALLEGANPCKVIKSYCESVSFLQLPRNSCIAQLQSAVIRQLIDTWQMVPGRLDIDDSFFIDCERYVTCADSQRASIESLSAYRFSVPWCRKPSRIIDDALNLLDAAAQNDATAMEKFKRMRNTTLTKLSDLEMHDLYRRAIVLLPNESCIVEQFGLTLMYLGREDLARKLFSQAVSRELWSHPLHRPVFQNIPGLKSKPFHDKKNFKFVEILEAGYTDIKAELLHNLEVNYHLFGLEQPNNNIPVGGRWTELRLKAQEGFVEKSKYFPNTMKYINKTQQEYINIKFSALTPGTHIRPHTGPSNALLRVHFTLIHTGGARMRVGAEWHHFEEGKAVIFDSSWEHEVVHDGDAVRVVLILDIWHPDVPKTLNIIQ